MIPLTPAFLVAAASGFVGLREQDGSERGLIIEPFLRGVGLPAELPWCAAFVHHVGYWSHFDYDRKKSIWPLPPTASCCTLGQFARAHDVLRDEPQPGDVFLVWNVRLGQFAHTGIVARVRESGESPGAHPWFDCDTIEGNARATDNPEGDVVLWRVRRFYPDVGDRFIRWADLDDCPLAGSPENRPANARRVA